MVLPESKLRTRRRRRRVRLAFLCILAAAVLVGGLTALSRAPFLRVTNVSVSGTQDIASSSVRDFAEERLAGNYFYLFSRRNILLYPRKEMAAALPLKFQSIKAVDVHAQDFHTIAVDLIERQPVALWCSFPDCFLMDEEGVIYAPAASSSRSGFIFYSGKAQDKQFLIPAQFRPLSALIDALSQKEETASIRDVAVDAAGDVSAKFSNGFMLKFALGDAGGDVFERFSIALTSEPFKAHPLGAFEYLDLRFGDKLYYKLR